MNNTFKAGDKIIRFSRVWRIFQVKKQKVLNENTEKVMFYKPVFPKNTSGNITFSIPVSKAMKAKIRRPVDKYRAGVLLKLLKQKPEKILIDINNAKEQLEQNNFIENVRVLRNYYWYKMEEGSNFTSAQKLILDLAIIKLSEEVAFVYGLSVGKAKQKIRNYMKSSDEKSN